jgi:hypothetical protein
MSTLSRLALSLGIDCSTPEPNSNGIITLASDGIISNLTTFENLQNDSNSPSFLSQFDFFLNFFTTPQDDPTPDTNPFDFCRKIWQYSPFKPSPHSYDKYITIFHPVIYDLILASLKLVCVLYLIFFIKKQYSALALSKKKNQNQDQTEQDFLFNSSHVSGSILIFPLYLRILIVLALLCLYQAIMSVLFPLKPSPNFSNPLVNSLTHALGSGIEHSMLEGVAVLLMFQGVGKRTTVRTVIISFIWGSICGLISFAINILPLSRLIVMIVLVSWTAVLLTYYTTLWLLPLPLLHRRPAIIPYARIFTLFHTVNLISQVLIYFKLPIGHCTLHLSHHGIFGVIIPYLIYRVLVNDSKYWQGLDGEEDNSSSYGYDSQTPSNGTNNTNGSSYGTLSSQNVDSIQGALVGITFDPNSARHVAKQMNNRNNARVNLISFAALRLEKNLSGTGPRHVILGAGSSARVYRGLYYDKRVAIKTVLCPELTQDIISSFYREASLLTKLSHPNIVAVEGMCVNPPALCLVMELCGGNLMDLLSTIYNNSHTAAISSPGAGSSRQQASRSMNLYGNNKNNDESNSSPSFSYYADNKSSSRNILRKKKPIRNPLHQLPITGQLDINSASIIMGGSGLIPASSSQQSSFPSLTSFLPGSFGSSSSSLTPNSSLLLGSDRIAPSSSMTMSAAPINIPLLLTPQLIPEYFHLDAVHQHPLEFWLELLRSEDPSYQEFTRIDHSRSSTNNSDKSDIPAPISLTPNDTILSWLSRVELMIQCCTAVDFLHRQKPPLLHLDIKSSNFLLGFDGRVKLADLELSRHIAITKDGDITIVPTISTSENMMVIAGNNNNNNNNFDCNGNFYDMIDDGKHSFPSSESLLIRQNSANNLSPSSSTGSLTTLTPSSSFGHDDAYKSSSYASNPTQMYNSPQNSQNFTPNLTQTASNSPNHSQNNSPILTPSSHPKLSSSPSFSRQPSHLNNVLKSTPMHINTRGVSHKSSVVSSTKPPSTAFLIDLLSDIVTNGPTRALAHDMAHRSQFNGITIPERVNWLAPELMLGYQYNEKVDVYALGCVLYEIITGKVPFFDLELQLKQLVMLPRGVSVYYKSGGQIGTDGGKGIGVGQHSMLDTHHSYNFGNNQNNSQLVHNLFHNNNNNNQNNNTNLPKSSQFLSTRKNNSSQIDSQQSLPLKQIYDGSDTDGYDYYTQKTLNAKKNLIFRSQDPNQSSQTTLKPPQAAEIPTNPTTDQIQTAIKVLVAIFHYRPIIPIDTPKIIRDLIEQAWHPNPESRPTCQHMAQVLTQIKFDLLKDGGLQHIY